MILYRNVSILPRLLEIIQIDVNDNIYIIILNVCRNNCS